MTESGKGLVGWDRKARQVRIRGSPENARRLEEALEEAWLWQREAVTRVDAYYLYAIAHSRRARQALSLARHLNINGSLSLP